MLSAEARRNARIKKILENSEQRLFKITGVENKKTVCELDGLKLSSSKEDESNETINRMRNAITANGVDSLNCLEQPFTGRLTTGCKQTETGHYPNISSEDSQRHKVLNTLQNSSNLKLIHILCIALFQNIIFITLDFLQIDSGTLYLGNIFIPLIAYDIYYYIFQSKEIPKPSFLNLLLVSYLNTNTAKYLKFSMCIFQIMQDMMVYFFLFIVLFNLQFFLKNLTFL